MSQGSVLGPLLFCIFVNVLFLYATNNNVVCDLFADDDSINFCRTDIKSVKSFLQEGLDDVSKWCDQNGMVIYPHKTKSMVLASRQKHQRKPLTIKLTLRRKNPVEQIRERWVLAEVTDDELKWQLHIDSICRH